MELAKAMNTKNNMTHNEATDVLKSAESALEAAENSYKVCFLVHSCLRI